jgi:transposase
MAKKGKKSGSRRAAAEGPQGASETAAETIARQEREFGELRKKVAELEMDRAILKKAAAFFAKESE